VSVALQIISELAQRGVTVRAEGECLKVKPKSAVDDDLLARLREHKPEILDVLSRRPATCGVSCYEIEPGRWIHCPGRGCRTIPPPPAATKVQSECWHCKGLKVCRCIVCWDARTDGPGQCITCKGTGRAWAWTH
jgi:hypothetical protein